MWWLCGLTVLSAADILINEVLYDPPGADSGHEFVELFNPGPAPRPLDGLELYFYNGSAPDAPELVWSAQGGETLAAGEWFVVGEDQVAERDRTETLGLQNGDEALELRRDGRGIDVVAWGSPVGQPGEGSPAPGASGKSIGRVPDGADDQDNAVDWVVLDLPTPGRENLAAEEFSIRHWWTRPAWREDAGPVELHLEVEALGWADLQAGEVELAGVVREVSLSRGSSAELEWLLECPRAEGGLAVQISGRNRPPQEHTLPLPRCGVGDLVFTEVQPRPREGEPEWVELLNRGSGPVSLDGWKMRDRGGRRRAIAEDVWIEPGGRVVLTADERELLDFYEMTAPVLRPLGGWPTLNDSEPEPGVAADSLSLLDPGGSVVDLVSWKRLEIENAGRPLQRSAVVVGKASIWMSAVSGPTPGEPSPDERREWPSEGLKCSPDPFTPDGDGIDDVLEILVQQGARVLVATVLDLAGDPVRELEAVRAGSRAAARWDGLDGRGRPVPAGAWVIVVDTEQEGGRRQLMRQVVGLGRRR